MLKDVYSWFKHKWPTIGPSKVTWLVAFTFPEKSVNVNVIPAPPTQPGPKTPDEHERHQAFHVIGQVAVGIVEGMRLQVKDLNRAVVLPIFKPIFVMRFRDALERTLAEQVRELIEWVDGVAWDVARRAEVFEDAGTGRGWAVAGAMWSEVGRLRKMYWVGRVACVLGGRLRGVEW